MRIYEDYYWLNEESVGFLENGYLEKGKNPKKRFREITETAEEILGVKGFADKFESYLKKGYYSLSSPIVSNFGNKKGLPISCNGSFIGDSVNSILGKSAEVGVMTKTGAGTSGYFGDLRPRGSKISIGGTSNGAVHFMEIFDKVTEVVSQSNVRRGSFAAYLPVEHADILEFLRIRSEGHCIQNMSIGVTITDQWMKEMTEGDKEKRSIWGKIVQKRFETGYPYIMFTDTVNNNAPQVYKDKGIRINASNLCSEICLSSDEENSFVCDLSSMNLLRYDEWKETDAVETLFYFLDAVMSEYIEKVKGMPFMDAAYNFAVNQRAIGVGVLGWHSYLQSNMIPFESMKAKQLNIQIFKFINEKTLIASKQMAIDYGEPELLKGYGLRAVTRMAVAPTTSSAEIFGQVSPSIEALNSNYFFKELAKGKYTYRNPYLTELLISYSKNDDDTWEFILKNAGGSVQDLDFLTQTEKDVFKTSAEISQMEVIIQASARQKYIDQSQSLNLMIPSNTPPREVSQLLIRGWELGIKTFYYHRGTNPSQDLSRNLMVCKSCEG